MREIIFRGKNINDEWVIGNLFISGEHFYIAKQRAGYDLDYIDFGFAFVEVDPSTVGQYTGLKDKNGKMIFEGDILRYLKVAGHTSTGIVKYITEFARWEYWHTQQNQGFPVLSDCDNMEVIGNIHDQKEDV